jgi:hypothetical protein
MSTEDHEQQVRLTHASINCVMVRDWHYSFGLPTCMRLLADKTDSCIKSAVELLAVAKFNELTLHCLLSHRATECHPLARLVQSCPQHSGSPARLQSECLADTAAHLFRRRIVVRPQSLMRSDCTDNLYQRAHFEHPPWLRSSELSLLYTALTRDPLVRCCSVHRWWALTSSLQQARRMHLTQLLCSRRQLKLFLCVIHWLHTR